MLILEISNRQNTLLVDQAAWRIMLTELLRSEGIRRGEVSISVVHDAEMHAMNRDYLDHDYPTDVLSFVLDRDSEELCGEIVVSADTATARCAEFGWSAHAELTLYLIHGALHLIGYNDKADKDRVIMRQREAHYLGRFGIVSNQVGPEKASR